MPSSIFAALQSAVPLCGSPSAQPKKHGPPEQRPAFIDWPVNHESHRVQDVVVGIPVDSLFEELWGNNAGVAATCRAKVGTREYIETDWLTSESDAETAFLAVAKQQEDGGSQPEPATPAPRLKRAQSCEYKSRCRMNCSKTSHIGTSVYSFERERCLEAGTGGPYVIEICVHSTATMANRFRCLFIHRLQAIDATRSKWTADFALVFVEKTNFLLKKTIETGANSGVKHNFATMAGALQELGK